MNIFAEELQSVLHKHGLTFYSLTNCGVHPQKIRRLVQSLTGTSFPVLNAEELDNVIHYFSLTKVEEERLTTAIWATGTQASLTNRLPIHVADHISSEIFKLLLANSSSIVGGAPHVFLSHSSHDEDASIHLASLLRNAGAIVWLDIDNISSGDFIKHINDGLREADWVIVVMTPNALKSTGVEMEVNAAIELYRQSKIKGIIPFVVKECDFNNFPPLLQSFHHYDATTNYDESLQSLLKVLGLNS